MSALIDLTGKRFGRLAVLRRATEVRAWRPMWRWRCDCGWEGAKLGQSLRGGAVRSCGSRACSAAVPRGAAGPGVS